MSKGQYVADDIIIFNLQGIRAVRSTDHSWDNKESFKVLVEYKGKEIEAYYGTDKVGRDAMYAQLRAALAPGKEEQGK